MKIKILLLASLLCVILAGSFVSGSSMAITPASNTFIYEGEPFHDKFILSTGDSGTKNVRVRPKTGNPFKLTFENGKSEYTFPLTGSKEITFTLEVPENMRPGEYVTAVLAEQYFTPEEQSAMGGTGIGVAAIGYATKVKIPTPGRYLEAERIEVQPSPVKVGENVFFKIPLLNLGSDELNNLVTDISIIDSSGKEIDKLRTNTLDALVPGGKGELRASWVTENRLPGLYKLEAEIEYGGKSPAKPEGQLKLGDIYVEIKDLRVEIGDGISKIYLDIASNWNDMIKGVYGEINIYKGDTVINTIKTTPVDLGPWHEEQLLAYWETKELELGNYGVEAVLHYGDKTTTKRIDFELTGYTPKEASTESLVGKSNVVTILVALVAVLLLVNILFFAFKSRKKK